MTKCNSPTLIKNRKHGGQNQQRCWDLSRLTFRLGTASQAMSAREGIRDVSRDSPLAAGRDVATSGDHKAGNRVENNMLG